ncbi:sigma-70 family RNA polymerase sigma factor [Halalkalibacillus halophilus]|uniref:sigma-70 family RNA polymerase sigma factor n=1 Tax=Halalkalibacillus halophilus TaxID=392827 RepID=UPI000413FC2C|nr:sigma-70 family RNA polymerase sigma factor [Halalkalibacillus halophilus]
MFHNYQEVEEFKEKNPTIFDHQIIQRFFHDQNNMSLLRRAIEKNDDNALKQLNDTFQTFYLKFRLVSYIAVLSHRYSSYYDQHLKKLNNQNLLILDKPVTENSELGDLFPTTEEPIESSNNLLDIVTDELIVSAIQNLSYKKRKVLELLFVYELSIKEIANQFGDTPQNISKHKKEAIKAIRTAFNNNKKKRDDEDERYK